MEYSAEENNNNTISIFCTLGETTCLGICYTIGSAKTQHRLPQSLISCFGSLRLVVGTGCEDLDLDFPSRLTKCLSSPRYYQQMPSRVCGAVVVRFLAIERGTGESDRKGDGTYVLPIAATFVIVVAHGALRTTDITAVPCAHCYIRTVQLSGFKGGWLAVFSY